MTPGCKIWIVATKTFALEDKNVKCWIIISDEIEQKIKYHIKYLPSNTWLNMVPISTTDTHVLQTKCPRVPPPPPNIPCAYRTAFVRFTFVWPEKFLHYTFLSLSLSRSLSFPMLSTVYLGQWPRFYLCGVPRGAWIVLSRPEKLIFLACKLHRAPGPCLTATDGVKTREWCPALQIVCPYSSSGAAV